MELSALRADNSCTKTYTIVYLNDLEQIIYRARPRVTIAYCVFGVTYLYIKMLFYKH